MSMERREREKKKQRNSDVAIPSLIMSMYSLEVLGVLSERLLRPLGHQVHRLPVPLGLFVKGGVFVARQHLVLFGKFEHELVDFLVSCQELTLGLQ